MRVTGDPRLLSRALRNLVDNAVRHAGSTVTLRVRADDRRAVLEVEDDGPGVPAADRERVFERFVRLDASRAGSERWSRAGAGDRARDRAPARR
ncbi:ATP-binding protein [Janibacter limosus]|uniref:ATP-binding protein n=1 Tax=Janibacter limosus TaxID=53458 RepID=UPI0035DA4783